MRGLQGVASGAPVGGIGSLRTYHASHSPNVDFWETYGTASFPPLSGRRTTGGRWRRRRFRRLVRHDFHRLAVSQFDQITDNHRLTSPFAPRERFPPAKQKGEGLGEMLSSLGRVRGRRGYLRDALGRLASEIFHELLRESVGGHELNAVS